MKNNPHKSLNNVSNKSLSNHKTNSKWRSLFAFTLAEVLITLGIIGIVASITIPTIMNKTQDSEFKTAKKKAYSVAYQAWNTAAMNGELTSRASWQDDVANKANFDAFKAKFSVAKSCDNSTIEDCFVNSDIDAWDKASYSAFIDNSGMAWSAVLDPTTSKIKGYIVVDTNGTKKPNIAGKDIAFLCTAASGYTSWSAGCPSTYNNSGIPNILTLGSMNTIDYFN